MPDNGKMLRVSKRNPCPVCGKADWCLVAEDGTAAICQRVQDGAVERCGDAGWLHVLVEQQKRPQFRSQRKVTIEQDDRPDKDFAALEQEYRLQIKDEQLYSLSQQLGVSAHSLTRLAIGWDGQAYSFPMRNERGRIIGIRRRFANGNKVSVTGSMTGLFIPADLSLEGPLLICEGPTDTAAALDLGFAAVGRPNCNSLVKMTVKVCRGRSVVIIADNDTKTDGANPGKEGAERLAEQLVLVCPDVRIVLPPPEYKDLRNWYKAGITRQDLLSQIENTKPLKLEIRHHGN